MTKPFKKLDSYINIRFQWAQKHLLNLSLDQMNSQTTMTKLDCSNQKSPEKESKKIISDYLEPRVRITLLLNDNKRILERSDYTLMALFGDIGGLYEVVIGLPSIVLTVFVERLFQRAIAALMPVKEKSQKSAFQE